MSETSEDFPAAISLKLFIYLSNFLEFSGVKFGLVAVGKSSLVSNMD